MRAHSLDKRVCDKIIADVQRQFEAEAAALVSQHTATPPPTPQQQPQQQPALQQPPQA